MIQKIEITRNGNTRVLRQNNNIVIDRRLEVKHDPHCITTEIRKKEKRFSNIELGCRYVKAALDIERRRGSEISYDMTLRRKKNRPEKKRGNTAVSPFTTVLGRRLPIQNVQSL